MDADKTACAVNALVTYSITERIRCLRLATGQIVYEFWTDGKQSVRIDATAYQYALDVARENMQDEEVPKSVQVAQATGRTPRGEAE